LFGINITISGSNNVVNKGLFLNFTFHIAVLLPDYGCSCWPKLVMDVRNKFMSEHLWCCFSQITIEDIN
jgi:hypothetical protein